MENIGASCFWDDPASASAGAGAGATSPSYQSQWLQKTLSVLDGKMKGMMTLLEDDKIELKQMLQELFTSYRSFAEKHDRLKALSGEVHQIGNNNKLGNLNDCKLELSSSDIQSESVVEDSDEEFNGTITTDHGFEHMNKLADELTIAEEPRFGLGRNRTDNQWGGGSTMLSELSFEVTKLLQENLRQQAELLRRNKEKREAIGKLRSRHQQQENRISHSHSHSQSLIKFTKVDVKRNRLKRFFSAGCSSFDMP